MTIQELKNTAKQVRKMILQTTHNAGAGHTGGSLSEVEILVSLFFHHMNVDPANPRWDDRDRFVLSKGHATPGYYSVLALRGFFDTKELDTFDTTGSILQGHPDMHKTPGVDISSGSLGQGLSCGIGMALGCAANGRKYTTFVVLGDGESQEGQVWEAAMYAGVHEVKHLVAIVDYNQVQLAFKTCEGLDLEPFADKWKSFKWQVLECQGHDMEDVDKTLGEAKKLAENGPVVVIAHTIKGKGVSFMEAQWKWHGKAPNDEEFAQAMKEVEEAE